MSQNNSTGTFSSIIVVAAFTLASSDILQQTAVANDRLMLQPNYAENKSTSGIPIAFYNQNSVDFVRSDSSEMLVDDQSAIMQQHHSEIIQSFSKHNEGFPTGKNEYISLLADTLCRLDFVDNLSSYNEYDNSIDIILFLSNGLKLSISQFIDEGFDAPVIFSIHRGRSLLISDEMPVEEMVNTINSVVVKLDDEYKA